VAIPDGALRLLTPPMLHQFRILDPADQTHLLGVYEWLAAHDATIDTLTAGLIHDVGKGCAKCRITILDRGLHVLLGRVLPRPYKRFARMETPPAFLRCLHRLANHPTRGALAAEQAGYNDRVSYLVRFHESGGDPHDSELALLRRSDREAGHP